MSAYTQLYLVPKKVYERFLNNTSQSSRETANQINNLDVQSGAKVTINGDCKESNISTDQPSVSETSIPEPIDDNKPIPNDDNGGVSNQFTSTEPTHSTSTFIPETQNAKKQIFVLDEDGVKAPKTVLKSKLDRLDWLGDEETGQKKDLFVQPLSVPLRKPSRKRFNKKFASSANVFKRNLSLSAAKKLLDEMKKSSNSKDDVIKPSKPLDFVESSQSLNPSLNKTDGSQVPLPNDGDNNEKPPRLKASFLADEDTPMFEDIISKRLNRKRIVLDQPVESPSNKEKKGKANLRKRVQPSRKVGTYYKKPKFDVSVDWESE